jgi:hypothetical protein
MVHPLWDSHEWESAANEQILSALFNAPAHIHPFDMGWIRKNKPALLRQYQQLFYSGDIPKYARRP